MDNLAKVFVGVDVSKKRLDINIFPENKFFRVENNFAGITKLSKKLSKFDVEQIVCESSGGYERKFIKQLSSSGYKTWIVDPKRIKAFMFAEGIKAKTDAIDAKMISIFASKTERTYSNVPAKNEKLVELVSRKNDLTDMIAKEKTHLKCPTTVFCKNSMNKHIAFMEKQVDKIDKQIEEIINEDQLLKQKYEILTSMPGIGKATAATLISMVPELGTIDNKKISALIGVAPYTKQSGTYTGVSKITGGRHLPRKAIYMSSLTASRFNPVFKKFYDRLISKNKRPKVVLVAVMRKIIITANAMIKNNENWRIIEI